MRLPVARLGRAASSPFGVFDDLGAPHYLTRASPGLLKILRESSYRALEREAGDERAPGSRLRFDIEYPQGLFLAQILGLGRGLRSRGGLLRVMAYVSGC